MVLLVCPAAEEPRKWTVSRGNVKRGSRFIWTGLKQMWNPHADQRRQRYLTLHTHFALNLNVPSRWTLSVSGRKRNSEAFFVLPSLYGPVNPSTRVKWLWMLRRLLRLSFRPLTLPRLKPSSDWTRTGLRMLHYYTRITFPVNCESTRFVQETENQNKRFRRSSALRSSVRGSSVHVNLWAAFAWKMPKFWCSCWSWAH